MWWVQASVIQTVEGSVTSYSSGSTFLPFLSWNYWIEKKKRLHLPYELKINRMGCTVKNQLPLAQLKDHLHLPSCLSILHEDCSQFFLSPVRHADMTMSLLECVGTLGVMFGDSFSSSSICYLVAKLLCLMSLNTWILTVASRKWDSPYQLLITTV